MEVESYSVHLGHDDTHPEDNGTAEYQDIDLIDEDDDLIDEDVYLEDVASDKEIPDTTRSGLAKRNFPTEHSGVKAYIKPIEEQSIGRQQSPPAIDEVALLAAHAESNGSADGGVPLFIHENADSAVEVTNSAEHVDQAYDDDEGADNGLEFEPHEFSVAETGGVNLDHHVDDSGHHFDPQNETFLTDTGTAVLRLGEDDHYSTEDLVYNEGYSYDPGADVENHETNDQALTEIYQAGPLPCEIIVILGEDELSLFPRGDRDSLLKDPNWQDAHICMLFEQLRYALVEAEMLTREEEIQLSFGGLGLTVDEDHKFSTLITLSEIVKLHEQLSTNDNSHQELSTSGTPTLYVTLSTRPRPKGWDLSHRFAHAWRLSQEGHRTADIASVWELDLWTDDKCHYDDHHNLWSQTRDRHVLGAVYPGDDVTYNDWTGDYESNLPYEYEQDGTHLVNETGRSYEHVQPDADEIGEPSGVLDSHAEMYQDTVNLSATYKNRVEVPSQHDGVSVPVISAGSVEKGADSSKQSPGRSQGDSPVSATATTNSASSKRTPGEYKQSATPEVTEVVNDEDDLIDVSDDEEDRKSLSPPVGNDGTIPLAEGTRASSRTDTVDMNTAEHVETSHVGNTGGQELDDYSDNSAGANEYYEESEYTFEGLMGQQTGDYTGDAAAHEHIDGHPHEERHQGDFAAFNGAEYNNYEAGEDYTVLPEGNQDGDYSSLVNVDEQSPFESPNFQTVTPHDNVAATHPDQPVKRPRDPEAELDSSPHSKRVRASPSSS